MNGEQRKLISNINNNYIHWDKFVDMLLPVNTAREHIWEIVLQERNQGYTRELHFDNIFVKWWISNTLESQIHQLDMGLAGGRNLEELLTPKHTHRYKTNAFLDESIASAQLAGAVVSKKAAKEMLLKKRSPQNVNEQICINIYRAMQLGFTQKDEELTELKLLQMHQTLTKDTIKLKGIGNYRSNNKVDTSAIENAAEYKPVDVKMLPELMRWFLSLYNNDTIPFFIHPLVKAAIFHYLIVSIRPFKDGNGRIARLLAQVYLLKKGYWVAEFISLSNVLSKFKPQYHKTFVQGKTDGNNAGYFVQFYIQSIQMGYKSIQNFVQRISKEEVEKSIQKLPGYNERQTAVLGWLKDDGDKIVTIRELRSVYGVSKETARTDLTALVEKKWLKYYHINKKTYAFAKGDRFDAQIEITSNN